MGQTPSSHKISARDRAVLDLKTQRDCLTQYQKRLFTLSAQFTARARQSLAETPPNRGKALHLLRQKRLHENMLQRTYEQLSQLESLVSQVEFAAVQVAVLEGLKQGSAVLKELNALVGGRKGVERVMDENEEMRADAEEVSEALGVGALSSEDNGEIEEELQRLQNEARLVSDNQSETTLPITLPDAPTLKLESRKMMADSPQKVEDASTMLPSS